MRRASGWRVRAAATVRSLWRLHAARRSGGLRDAGGRERLRRYLARPALARTRLEETPGGRIRVTFKRPWADGTAGVTFTLGLGALGPPIEQLHTTRCEVPDLGRAAAVCVHGGRLALSALRRSDDPPRCCMAERHAACPRAPIKVVSFRLAAGPLRGRRPASFTGHAPLHPGSLPTERPGLATLGPTGSGDFIDALDGLDAAAGRAPPDSLAV